MSESIKRPNLLFIMCDQQRYDCIGFAGIRPVKTPSIDRIAKKGAWFEKAYTPIPVCAPARQSLFCGKRPEYYGALWNFHITFPIAEVPQDSWFFPRHIKQSGYNTAHCGKWNVSNSLSPDKYGFDSYITEGEINRIVNEKSPNIKWNNGYFGEPSPIPLEDSFTHVLADKVIENINDLTDKEEPWFINVDFPTPHLPCRPSEPFASMYKAEDMEEWGGFCDTFENKPYMHYQQVLNWNLENKPWEEWAKTVALYYGIISQYDDAIGKILDHLEKTGEIENTVIVYTCDHGDLCGSHRMIDKHYVMYEDLTHVPMTICFGDKIKTKKVSGYVHNTLDIVPTVLDLLEIDTPENGTLHGESLCNVLTKGEEWTRDFAVSSYNGQQFGLFTTRSITVDGFKYVWNLSDIDEFYNLESDPYELKNVIEKEEYQSKIMEMRRKMYDELKRCDDKIIGWTSEQLLKPNRKHYVKRTIQQ